MKKWFLIFLAVLFWAAAAYWGGQIHDKSERVSVRFQKDEAILEQQVRPVGKEYPMTAYEEIGKIKIRESVTGREVELEGFHVWGEKRRIYDAPLLFGSYGIEERKECVISRGAARRLFQSEDVVGCTVNFGDEAFIIRGIMDRQRPVILFTAKADSRLTHFEIDMKESLDKTKDTEELFFRYQINNPEVIYDYGLYSGICRIFCFLPAYLGLLLICQQISIHFSDQRLRVAAQVLFWGGFFLLLFQTFRLPSGYIPVKWSDLKFWQERYQVLKQNFSDLWSLAAPDLDRTLRRNLVSCVGSAVFSSGLLLARYIMVRLREKQLHLNHMLSTGNHNHGCD